MTGTPLVLGFGASSMKGAGDSQGGFLKRMERATAGRARFLNAGVGGDTTRDMMARLASVRGSGHSLTIIMLGCNDMPRRGDGQPGRRTALAEYAGNLRAIFATLASARSIFATSFQVDWAATGIEPELFDRYMQAAKDAATGYELWDLHAESASYGPAFLAKDGVHYNDAGHQHLAATLLARCGLG
jgi:lysophospholipase L1-like esterase